MAISWTLISCYGRGFKLSWVENMLEIMGTLIQINAPRKVMLFFIADLTIYLSSAKPQCAQTNFCQLAGTSGMSSISSMVPRPQQLSCAGLCSQSESCFAVTFDPSGDTCELHSDPDGAECFSVREDPGKSLLFREPKGMSCPKVWALVTNIITVLAAGRHDPLFAYICSLCTEISWNGFAFGAWIGNYIQHKT